MSENRLLILLNPGRQSRHYMLGVAAAAHRMGMPYACVELESLWNRFNNAQCESDERSCVQSEMSRLVRHHRITHVIGYAWNSVMDFGMLAPAPGTVGEPLFAALGVRNILLWTDHPNWFRNGEAMRPQYTRLFSHPLHTHIVKSQTAADEVAGTLGWSNVHAMPMAEDYHQLLTAREAIAVHDVVAIVGATTAIPPEVAAFVDVDSPDPHEIDAIMLPTVTADWHRWADGHHVPYETRAAGEVLLNLKLADPSRSVWSHASRIDHSGLSGLAWLRSDPSLWFGATKVFSRLVAWRRDFYLAWLARRVDLGIYGSSARPIGVNQPQGADEWIEYGDQASIYARGRVTININAAHDEEGCTHKPFQIAASRTACVHHHTRGLDGLFVPGHQVLTFDHPATLLDRVNTLLGSQRDRVAMGAAMHERATQQHTWQARLTDMLNLSDHAIAATPTYAAAA